MEKLTTVFKFVGAGNGGGSAATDTATSSVATGDIAMLIAGIMAVLIGAVAIWATVAYRKHAAKGAHVAGSNATFMPLIAAAVAIVLGLGLTIASTSSIKAHAEGAITTTDCIGTVDEQTGSVTFSDITMTNNSKDTQLINDFNFKAAEGVTGLNDVVWTFEAETIYGEETLFKGKFGDPVEEGWLPLDMPAGFSSKISVSATGISPEVAKSLIGKEVAYQTCSYDALYTVSASVEGGSTYGTVSPESLYIVNGTTYKVNGNDIVFGEDDDALTITFTPAEGYKLKNWTLNGDATTEGKVASDLSFVAVTETAVPYYTGTVTSPEVDESGTVTDKGLAGATVTFTSASTNEITSSKVTDENGNYILDVAAPTEGSISVTKGVTGEATYGYSTDSFNVNTSKGEQTTTHIGKIQSLGVKVFQKHLIVGTGETNDLCDTYWCPAFSSDSSSETAINIKNIKFYQGTSSTVSNVITPEDESGYYTMSELVDSLGSTVEAYMKAKYFAICTASSKLNCYQTTQATYKDAFGTDVAAGSSASKLSDSFSTATNTSGETVSRVADKNGNKITPKAVYWDSKDSNNWIPENKEEAGTNPYPTVNSVYYFGSSTGDSWINTYYKAIGGPLSFYSTAWSPFLTNERKVFYRTSVSGTESWVWQQYETSYEECIVLSQVFTN